MNKKLEDDIKSQIQVLGRMDNTTENIYYDYTN